MGYSRKYSADLVNSVFDIISNKLMTGHNVRLSGFGCFLLRDKKSRSGRNPQTGNKITIKARRVVAFQSSPSLKKQVKTTSKRR